MMSARLFELNRIGKAAGAEAQNLDGILTPSRSSPHRNHDQRGQPLLHRHSWISPRRVKEVFQVSKGAKKSF